MMMAEALKFGDAKPATGNRQVGKHGFAENAKHYNIRYYSIIRHFLRVGPNVVVSSSGSTVCKRVKFSYTNTGREAKYLDVRTPIYNPF
jgi:hypothetical protein